MIKFNICKLDTENNYLNTQKELVVNYLTGLGNSREFVLAMLNYDNNCVMLWAEVDSTPVGLICYSVKRKGVTTVLFASADSTEYEETLYDELEKISKNEGRWHIGQILSIKDAKNIDFLKRLGYRQEFYHLFKKV